jgi:phage regulator Rha-like protein
MKNAQTNLKNEERLTTSKIAETTKIRDQALRNEIKNYINDVDEILTNSIVSVIII